ncbi:uncharacterized protein [Choristoneura fumiferana]|uniref:uncharacterized protein n=1 Tax=Choristoneura fumiferana TaxID=7141 RepID=UPI003D1568E6
MFFLLLLCITAHSTPIKAKSFELSKSSIARSKLMNILNDAIHHQDNQRNPNEKNNLNNKNEIRKLNLIDLESSKKKVNYEDVKLAFNEEATDLLNKLISALETVNENLSTQNKKLRQTKTKELYVVKVNENQRFARHKRDTNDISDVEVKKNTSTDPEVISVKPTEEDKSTTEAKTVNETTTNVNKTEVNHEKSNCNQTNSRRSFNPHDIDTEISKAVKTRLLSYINEYFNDITAKTNSLREIKKTFAASDEYSIGYIIANIDTLAINLHNLRLDIETNHPGWSEKQILDMFDKIKMSHKVVSSLLEALKTIIDRPLVKDGKGSQYLHVV